MTSQSRAGRVRHFETLFHLMQAIPNEQAAIDHFTAIRWANGAYCPDCGGTRIYHFSDKRNHKCADCRKRFSIKVGTVFEGSKIELRKWLMAIWLITSHKKGIASTQLAKDIGVTQKTAWFMLHRLRHVATTPSFQRELSGEVEIDETIIGGSVSGKGKGYMGNKSIVLGMMERGGDLVTKVITERHKAAMHSVILDNVRQGSTIHTDSHGGYKDISQRGYKHTTVNHNTGIHATKEGAGTNAVEGFWSLLKRQITGIHHYVSQKHVGYYVAEASWRYNLRGMNEGARVNALIAESSGRLRYKELMA